MAAITITREEAARDFAGLVDRVLAGDEVVIAGPSAEVVMHRRQKDPSIEATIARFDALRQRHGDDVLRMGSDFADDLEEIVRNRKPRDRSMYE